MAESGGASHQARFELARSAMNAGEVMQPRWMQLLTTAPPTDCAPIITVATTIHCTIAAAWLPGELIKYLVLANAMT